MASNQTTPHGTDDLKATFYSTELAKSTRDEYVNGLHLAKFQRLRKDWIAFCDMMEFRRPEFDLSNPRTIWEPRPQLPQVKALLTWYARTKKGQLDSKVTVQTIKNDWNYLQRDIRSLTGHFFTQQERADMDFFIQKELLTTEGLSTKARPKALADLPVVEDVIDYLWQRDEYYWRDPRTRIQMAIGILFVWYMGIRTSEFVHNMCSLPNEGILWKDINISLIYETSPVFHVQVTLRNRKGRRGNERTFETENLREERERWRCPVTLILALAVEDKALQGIETVQDLQKIRFSQNTSKREIKIRNEKREIPLLRTGCLGGGEAHPEKILTGSSFARELKQLGYRAGYVEDLTPYNIRRGFGNRLDKEVTEAERSRHFGHQNAVTFQHYLSRSAPCDVQGIMNGTTTDQGRVDFFRSMRSKIDRAAPTHSHSSLAEPWYQRREDMAQSRMAQMKNNRKQYFDEPQDDLFEGSAFHQTFRTRLERQPQSRLLQNFLYYDPERSRVIQAMFCTPDCDIFTAVGAVAGLLARKQYRPLRQIVALHSTEHGFHCYMCTADVKSPDEWETHCRTHLQDRGLLCGRIARYGALVWPGLCPFCMSDESLPGTARLHQFLYSYGLYRHVSLHLRKQVWPRICPHPRCAEDLGSSELFWDHMSTVHGYSPPTRVRAPVTTVESLSSSNIPGSSLEAENEWHCPFPECAKLSSSIKTKAEFMHHAGTHTMRPCGRRGCNETFKTNEELGSHLYNAHQVSDFTCQLESLVKRDGTLCGKTFETITWFKQHQIVHKRQERLRCPAPRCRLVFRKDKTYTKHRRDAHSAKGDEALPPPISECTSLAQKSRKRKLDSSVGEVSPLEQARSVSSPMEIAQPVRAVGDHDPVEKAPMGRKVLPISC